MIDGTFERSWAAIAAVDGWLTAGQARRLHDAAARCTAGERIVEIGSFRGRSTIVLAAAAPDGVEVIAIDPHAGNDRGPREIEGFAAQAADDHRIFWDNLRAAGVEQRVRHVRQFSEAAHGEVDGPIDVLYIDGAHRYGPARADIAEWGARVRDGGTMLIHDAFSSVGVTAALARELFVGRRWRYVGRSRSLVEYRADLGPDAASRMRNVGAQMSQMPWFAVNVALKVALTLRLGGVLGRFRHGRVPEWPY